MGRRVNTAPPFLAKGFRMMDDEIESHEVDRGRWRDLEGLFDSRGGPR